MKLTREQFLEKIGSTHPTAAQARILGIPYPLQSGWLNVIIHRDYTPAQLQSIVAGRKIRKPNHRANLRASPDIGLFRGEKTPEDFANEMFKDDPGAFL